MTCEHLLRVPNTSESVFLILYDGHGMMVHHDRKYSFNMVYREKQLNKLKKKYRYYIKLYLTY